jgi:hypothetical protein
MEATRSSERAADFRQTTGRDIPENRILQAINFFVTREIKYNFLSEILVLNNTNKRKITNMFFLLKSSLVYIIWEHVSSRDD